VPDTFIKIASVTVGAGGASSISFSSIPSTYTDLVVKLSARSSGAVSDMLISFNGSTSNFTWRLVGGNGSSPFSSTGAASYGMLSNSSTTTSNTFASSDLYIPNYNSSNNKSASIDAVNENNGTAASQYLDSILWSQTSAITSIGFSMSGSDFVQYSTAVLYGIKNS